MYTNLADTLSDLALFDECTTMIKEIHDRTSGPGQHVHEDGNPLADGMELVRDDLLQCIGAHMVAHHPEVLMSVAVRDEVQYAMSSGEEMREVRPHPGIRPHPVSVLTGTISFGLSDYPKPRGAYAE